MGGRQLHSQRLVLGDLAHLVTTPGGTRDFLEYSTPENGKLGQLVGLPVGEPAPVGERGDLPPGGTELILGRFQFGRALFEAEFRLS